jgi:neutral ceramidase
VRFRLPVIALILLVADLSAAADQWRAGVGTARITPDGPIWMAGYAARKKPSEGVSMDLSAKALALEDAKGSRVVIVTTDILGFPRAVSEPIAEKLRERYSLPRGRVLFSSSHTHSGPVVRESLVLIYDLDPGQAEAIRKYTAFLESRVVEAVGAALRDLAPARLEMGKGTAGFGINRREKKPAGYVIGVNPDGVTEHDVPVLKVSGPDGRLKALLFSYACHNTTLGADNTLIHGDYAGVAQKELEARIPGATALFMAGCAADTNPSPRGTMELVRAHGLELAEGVQKALSGALRPLGGSVDAALERIDLPLSTPPSRSDLEKKLADPDVYRQRNAKAQLAILDAARELPRTYPYTIQVLRLGDSLTLVALAGEVVVDYALRLKGELGSPDNLWVVGYANDVFAYIPSRRVLAEGGYEADSSMIYYGLHGPWAPDIEEMIVGRVSAMTRKLGVPGRP